MGAPSPGGAEPARPTVWSGERGREEVRVCAFWQAWEESSCEGVWLASMTDVEAVS